jgi:4-hydroxybenzoate polyprenyltransferase
MNRAVGLVQACHPVPTAGVTVLTAVLAAAVGHSIESGALVVAAVFAGQLSIGWSNDAIDAERDARSVRSDKPVATGAIPRATVAMASVAALLVTTGLSLATGLVAGAVHLLFVACGWAYNLGLKRTVFSFVPYAIGFAALPSYVVLALPGGASVPWWLATAGGLLGVGAHLVDVLPDVDADLATGIRGWPHRLGRRRAAIAAAVTLGGASVLLTLAPPGRPSGAALAGLAAATTASTLVAWAAWRRPAAGRALMIGVISVALVDIGLLLIAGAEL